MHSVMGLGTVERREICRYLATALIGYYESYLITCSGDQIEKWFAQVGTGQKEWYQHMKQADGSPVHNNWQSFISSWLQAATFLQRETPIAFSKALGDTETWAQSAGQRQEKHAVAVPTAVKHEIKEGEWDIFGQTSNPTDVLMTGIHAIERSLGYGHSVGEVSQEALDDTAHGTGQLAYIKRYPQESQSSSACLWAYAEEVIPCLCGSMRRSRTSLSSLESDTAGAAFKQIWTSNIEEKQRVIGRYLPSPITSYNQEPPYYFAVDCRSSYEKRLGRFPKALSLDPRALTDPESLDSLLQSLQPLVGSTHICLIGAGEEYVRINHHQYRGESDRDRALEEAVLEQVTRLNAIAVFFMKQNFSRISVLDGGFSSAIRYLHSDKSPISLSSALVDAHGPSLDALLGGVDVLRQGKPTVGVSSTGDMKSSNKMEAVLSVVSTIGQLATPRHERKGEKYVDNSEENSSVSEEGRNDRQSIVSGLVANIAGSTVDRREQMTEGAIEVLGDIGRKFNTFKSVLKKSIVLSSTVKETEKERENDGVWRDVPERDKSETRQDNSGANRLSGLRAMMRDHRGRADSPSQPGGQTARGTDSLADRKPAPPTGPTFTIDSEEDEEVEDSEREREREREKSEDISDGERGKGKLDIPDTTTVNITRTEAEKAQALAVHHLSGLRAGDTIRIAKECLPGAVLFPSLICGDSDELNECKSESPGVNNTVKIDSETEQKLTSSSETVTDEKEDSNQSNNTIKETNIEIKSTQLHRFLVVTRERFIVLDSSGGGVGSIGVVTANHHLTELLKMTFRKREPDLVTLYFVSYDSEPKTKQFRVSKRNEFVECLQKHMRRFK